MQKRFARLRALLPAIAMVGIAACDGPSSDVMRPGASSHAAATAAVDLGSEIRSLVSAGFPKGQATSILAKWDQVLRALDNPKVKLRGTLVPAAAGRSELTRTIAYITLKSAESTPPAGETQAHFVARLVLDMSLYVYSGPSTPPPTLALNSDVAFKLVQPATADTVLTPAKEAGVVFPANSVVEPTVVVVTPEATHYPDNCAGPLDTHVCQYPLFYHFNVFPDVKLNTPATVQVCHVDAGTSRLPLAVHDRFRVAHEKPADPANYSAGSSIVDNVEILALAIVNVTTCRANGGTQYVEVPAPGASPIAQLVFAGRRMVHGVSAVARAFFVPKDVYAIDVGGGGFAELFSTFGVVDPQSVPDLAQSTSPATRFTPTAVSGLTGTPLPLAAWNVTNVGSGTSGAFTSNVVVASDSGLTAPVLTTPVGGAASLIARASYTYPAQSITLPSAPGTYFVGTRVIPAGADSTAADDWTSVRVVVTAPVVATPADIAILAPFTASPFTVAQGAAVGVSAFTVRNLGTMPSGPFVMRMTLATDTLLRSIITWPVLAGPSGLAGGTTHTYPASEVAISPCQQPGSYFVGPRLEAVASDANASNDQLSARINVISAPAPISQSAGSSAWTAAGPGQSATQINPHCAILSYNDTPSNPNYTNEVWTFTTTAVTSGPYTFTWKYSGLHSWYQAHAGLDVLVKGPSGPVEVTLWPEGPVSGDFSFSGTATLDLTAGYTWSIRTRAGHFDSSRIMRGTVQIIDAGP